MTLMETACVAVGAMVLTPHIGMVSDYSLFDLRRKLTTV